MGRVMFGALAGISATTAMTVAMRHLRPLLSHDPYPLPPREIFDRVSLNGTGGLAPLGTVISHFAFGALAGAIYGMIPRRQRPGGVPFSLMVWAASYLGWIPAFGILKSAVRHPIERNLLMLAAHAVWGVTLAASLRELEAATADIFAGGPKRDAPANIKRG